MFSLFPIKNACFAPLYQGRSICEDFLYYNWKALTDLLSIWIISYNTKMDDEGGGELVPTETRQGRMT